MSPGTCVLQAGGAGDGILGSNEEFSSRDIQALSPPAWTLRECSVNTSQNKRCPNVSHTAGWFHVHHLPRAWKGHGATAPQSRRSVGRMSGTRDTGQPPPTPARERPGLATRAQACVPLPQLPLRLQPPNPH